MVADLHPATAQIFDRLASESGHASERLATLGISINALQHGQHAIEIAEAAPLDVDSMDTPLDAVMITRREVRPKRMGWGGGTRAPYHRRHQVAGELRALGFDVAVPEWVGLGGVRNPPMALMRAWWLKQHPSTLDPWTQFGGNGRRYGRARAQEVAALNRKLNRVPIPALRRMFREAWGIPETTAMQVEIRAVVVTRVAVDRVPDEPVGYVRHASTPAEVLAVPVALLHALEAADGA